jgi:hypothetical protein
MVARAHLLTDGAVGNGGGYFELIDYQLKIEGELLPP